MQKRLPGVPILLLLLLLTPLLSGAERFPKPQFDTGYRMPTQPHPAPRAGFLEYADIALLAGALVLASWLVLKKRSRTGIFFLMAGSLAYFGFVRGGCVCPVGSLQNVTAALFTSGYVLPVGLLVFFLLPIAFALYTGRTFCAGVCPLGAIQDAVLFRPLRLPRWLSRTLGSLPYIYLSFAVLFASTGMGFLICRFDPFVSFFRMSGSFPMIVFGVGMLILSAFVARPYCRFLCPYGVLLGWASRLSRRHLTITPDECIQCRLCEDACPFDAIEKPAQAPPRAGSRGLRSMTLRLLLIPLLAAGGGWTFSRLAAGFSRSHPDVTLARRISLEDSGRIKGTTLESRTFRAGGTSLRVLKNRAKTAAGRLTTGGWILGIFLGLAFSLRLAGQGMYRTRTDFEPDRERCYSCGRCFDYCPRHKPGDGDGGPDGQVST